MKQTLYLTQFVIMMVLILGITTTVLSLETNITTEGGSPAIVQALAHIACKGNKGCIAKTLKAAKCGSLAKFSLAAVNKSVASYKDGLKKKSIKIQIAASSAFKKAVAPVVACSITPGSMKAAFKRGFKIAKSKKAAKKLAKKAKKASKVVKKAKKAAKKAAKKGKKSAKKAAKKGKKSAKKAAKKGKKSAKKAKKSAKKAVKKAKKAVKKAAKKGKKAAAKKGKKAAKKAKKSAKKAKKSAKKAVKKAKKAGKKAKKAGKKGKKVAAFVAIAKSLLALVLLC
jgi:hypothetical protein